MQVVRKRRALLLGVLAALVVAVVSYGSGVIGFNEGFRKGYELAQISDGLVTVQALSSQGQVAQPGDFLLNGIIDNASLSCNMMQQHGPSVFDVIGVDDVQNVVEQTRRSIREYRREHPPPKSQAGGPRAAE